MKKKTIAIRVLTLLLLAALVVPMLAGCDTQADAWEDDVYFENLYVWNGTAWVKVTGAGGGGGLWEVDGAETQLIIADAIDMQSHKIINVVDPTANQEVATKKYVDDNAGVSLWEVDGAETQIIIADEIDMQTKKIINVVDPTNNQDAATKKYVDDNVGDMLADDDGDTKIQVEESADEDKIRFDTGGTERMIIDNWGNVGIGTANPGREVEIYSASPSLRIRDSGATADSCVAFIEFGGTNAGAWSRTGFIGDSASANANIKLVAEAADLLLDAAGDIILTPGGNVGIGATLDVAGDITVTGNVDGVDVSTHSTATTGVHGVGAETILHTGNIGSSLQAWDAELDDIAALADTAGNFIVGSVAGWVAESGATVRTSLGLTIGTDVPSQSSFDDHSARHLVGGADTIFPTDPNADRYLMWDDTPTGELVWATVDGGGDMNTSTYDTDVDGDIDTAAGGTEWNSSAATGVAYITAGAWGTKTIGIADDNIVEMDDLDATTTDYARFTTNGLEGRDATEVKTDLGLIIGTNVQAWDTELDDIAALADTDGNFIVGSGAIWVAESGATVRASLGLTIGTHVQAWDDDLDDIAALTPTDSYIMVGDGTNWVTESGATLRTSLGLGTGDTPQFTGIEVGDASDTTVARSSTGHVSVEADILLGESDVDDTPADGDTADPISSNWAFDHDADGSAHQSNVITITFMIDGEGSAITTGEKGYLEIPFACTLTGWTLLADQSGSIVIDVWNDTYANFPPTVADTIAGSEKPTLSAAEKNQDLALGTWTTAVGAGDILAFNVDSAATVERVTLSIRATKT